MSADNELAFLFSVKNVFIKKKIIKIDPFRYCCFAIFVSLKLNKNSSYQAHLCSSYDGFTDRKKRLD